MKKWIVFGAAFVAIAIAERKRPLRARTAAEWPRLRSNFAMAGLTAAVTAALQKPLVDRAFTDRGLLSRLPRPLRFLAGILLLDYTLWWWHRANHVVPALWRFHVVHHLDRDLDVSTALRFHFGEMALAAVFRAAQVRVLGVDRDALGWWQTMLLISILFHHSNIDLGSDADGQLMRFLVTPRMHGIHHADVFELTNSNWSSLFTWWDMLHRTFIYRVPQASITIGAPGRDEDLPLGRLLAAPFTA